MPRTPQRPAGWGGIDLSGMYHAGQEQTVYGEVTSKVSGIGEYVMPHHPLQCPEWEKHWKVGEDGMECVHASVDGIDLKLQAALRVSVCNLIMEFAYGYDESKRIQKNEER